MRTVSAEVHANASAGGDLEDGRPRRETPSCRAVRTSAMCRTLQRRDDRPGVQGRDPDSARTRWLPLALRTLRTNRPRPLRLLNGRRVYRLLPSVRPPAVARRRSVLRRRPSEDPWHAEPSPHDPPPSDTSARDAPQSALLVSSAPTIVRRQDRRPVAVPALGSRPVQPGHRRPAVTSGTPKPPASSSPAPSATTWHRPRSLPAGLAHTSDAADMAPLHPRLRETRGTSTVVALVELHRPRAAEDIWLRVTDHSAHAHGYRPEPSQPEQPTSQHRI